MELFSEMGQGWINTVPVSLLDMWVYEGTQYPLCINDGRIVGCEKEKPQERQLPGKQSNKKIFYIPIIGNLWEEIKMEKSIIGIAVFDPEKYEAGVAAVARLDALKNFTIKSEYSISREDIASILGFELPAKVGRDE